MLDKEKLLIVIILFCLVSTTMSSSAVLSGSAMILEAHPSLPSIANIGDSWSHHLIPSNYSNGSVMREHCGGDKSTASLSDIREITSLSPKEYEVIFIERGLPTGTRWYISLNGTNESSLSNEITFLRPNGSYGYIVGLIHNFTVTPFAGSFSISGASENITITYSRFYQVVFRETGLPSGIKWSIAFNGVTTFPSSDNITLLEKNGSYPYTINVPINYTTSPTTGTIIINGSGATVNIQFSVYSITFTGSVTPKGASMFINGQQVTTVGGVFTLTLLAGHKYEMEVTSPGYWNYFYNFTVTSKTYPTVLHNVELVPLEVPQMFSLLDFILLISFIGVVTGSIWGLTKRFMRGRRLQ